MPTGGVHQSDRPPPPPRGGRRRHHPHRLAGPPRPQRATVRRHPTPREGMPRMPPHPQPMPHPSPSCVNTTKRGSGRDLFDHRMVLLTHVSPFTALLPGGPIHWSPRPAGGPRGQSIPIACPLTGPSEQMVPMPRLCVGTEYPLVEDYVCSDLDPNMPNRSWCASSLIFLIYFYIVVSYISISL